MVNAETLTDVQKKIFETIPKGDVGELKTLLTQLQGTADFVDENFMTPLQHACYKGNTELVQTLLDQVRLLRFKFCSLVFVFDCYSVGGEVMWWHMGNTMNEIPTTK